MNQQIIILEQKVLITLNITPGAKVFSKICLVDELAMPVHINKLGHMEIEKTCASSLFKVIII